jgi:hypothetical protein
MYTVNIPCLFSPFRLHCLTPRFVPILAHPNLDRIMGFRKKFQGINGWMDECGEGMKSLSRTFGGKQIASKKP